MTPFSLKAAAAAFFMLAALSLSVAAPAAAGETATTHRAGDLGVYRFACHDAASMIAIAERGGQAELAAALVESGACFSSPSCIEARLEAWVAGPYTPGYGHGARGAAGSVWRVADQFGNTEYVWIDDSSGRHPARRAMGL